MAFKKSSSLSAVPATPEALYPTLPRAAGAPKELWSRQADVLRVYVEQHKAAGDVAIELPTGAGKTLVGCLVAEWRRQSRGERVAFLTPTRHLAQQAAAASAQYGIPSVDLTGRHTEWSASDALAFNQAKAVAFATYSALFNTNPHLRPQVLILDDAHAAEGSISSTWSMSIRRNDGLYDEILQVLVDHEAFSAAVTRRLRGRTAGRTYLAGVAETAAAVPDLESLFDTAHSRGDLPRSVRFGYQMLAERLSACLIFASSDEMLIRPLVAPTLSHTEFEDAKQRVYLSATLGEGGELERAFGRKRIARIEAPANWENQGTGRRFFCFPSLVQGLEEKDAPEFVSDQILAFRKAVLLTPDKGARNRLVDAVKPAGMHVWHADEADDAPQTFAGAPEGILGLANRYDGIDLPDNACRLIVMSGSPKGAHLQERFLYESVGAHVVLNERIRTRITQGAGRATRNSADYAAVLMLGRDLLNFCMPQEHLAAMHPELRAEIAFGLQYSDMPMEDVRENLEHFREQDEDWREANQAIRSARDETARAALPGTEHLQAAVPYEVAALDAAWQGEWDRAVEQAKKVIDVLPGSPEIRRYQALWHYLLASWAVMAGRRDGQSHWEALANRHFSDARAAARGTQWLSELTTDAGRLLAPPAVAVPQEDPLHAWVIDAIASNPARTSARKYAGYEEALREGLAQTAHKPFEAALNVLGQMVGAETLPATKEQGRPDSVWMFGDHWWIAIEAKSEAEADKDIPAGDVRQALGHLPYAAAQTGRTVPDGSLTLIATSQSGVAKAGTWVADKPLYVVSPQQLQEVAERICEAWDAIRARTEQLAPGAARPLVAELLAKHQALPDQWLPLLTTHMIGVRL
ncbi:DEAD/DEAH box helicase family protein [Streptomyces yangpuensis]|uniref:DEAD/DEAH box helicase family protein n=1 Tax=Streptomyces yangpuensis TaxID=1648182 RepID=UPI0036A2E292